MITGTQSTIYAHVIRILVYSTHACMPTTVAHVSLLKAVNLLVLVNMWGTALIFFIMYCNIIVSLI